MAILDPLFDGLAGILRKIDNLFDRITAPDTDGEQATDALGQAFEQATPADEVAAAIIDSFEEFVLSELQDAGELTPENVEQVADLTEGGAVSVLAGLGLAGSAVEAASLGQIDQQQQYITQALAGLGVDDVTGTELAWRLEKGVGPAMEAKVGKEHRSEFASIQDAVEYLLRNKDGDTGWLQGENVPQDAYSKIQSNEPVNPDNALEEWGIRDDQLDILEFVALEAMEFEELIETPAELGLVVDDEVLELVLDLAGYPEPLKDFLRQVPDEIPRSNRAWEERTAVETLVDELDTLAADGEISPADARALLPAEVDVAADALEDRWRNLQQTPPGPPTRSLVENSFTNGFTDLQTLRDRLERLEYDVDAYEDVLRYTVYNDLDGDLQQALALGLLSENEFTNLAAFAGIDQDATNALLRGESFSDITDRRLSQEADLTQAPTSAIQGIGESRERALSLEGIDTLADLAQADAETVAEAAEVSPETAQGWIDTAQQAVQQAG